MIFHAEVYSIADKYDIPTLATYSQEKFKDAVATGWATDDFPKVILEAYSSTPESVRGLRDPILNVCREHIAELIEKPAFIEVARTTTCLFAADLAKKLAKSNPSESYRCPSCGRTWISTDVPQATLRYCMFCGNSRSDWPSYKSSS